MKHRSFRQHMADAYAEAALPAERVERLQRLAELTAPAHHAGRPAPGRWRRATWSALAACAAASVIGNVYLLSTGRPSVPQVVDKSQTLRPTPPGSAMLSPNLVVARVHADWCQPSLDLAPFYMDLGEEYRNQPVIFVTLDITDDRSREAALRIASTLGIDIVTRAPFESGVIKLVDRSAGKILAEVSDHEQMPAMELALAMALPAPP